MEGFEPPIPVPETGALPLGDIPLSCNIQIINPNVQQRELVNYAKRLYVKRQSRSTIHTPLKDMLN